MKLEAKQRLLADAESQVAFLKQFLKGKSGDKFALKCKAFLNYLDLLSYKNPSGTLDLVTAETAMPGAQVGLALSFAADLSNLFGDIVAPSKIWRSDLAPLDTKVGDSFVYKHKTHPNFSSWTTIDLTKKPKALSDLESQRGTPKGTKSVILESTDAKGKVVWTPDSNKLVPKLISICDKLEKQLPKGDPAEGVYYNISMYAKKIQSALKVRKEKEVILYHPSGVKVTVKKA